MCTMISKQIKIEGSGKNAAGWFNLKEADVSYDHPFHAPYEHALNLDFVNEAMGPGARVAVEDSWKSKRSRLKTPLFSGAIIKLPLPQIGAGKCYLYGFFAQMGKKTA